ncbi:MAG: YbjN domain-containing protein [Pirellulales bacterium]
MNSAFEKLVGHFEDRDLRFAAQEERQTVTADFRGEVGTFRVLARVDDAEGLFQVFGYMPVRIPEGARPAIAEAITRANFGLKIGKFEMDMDDGEVLFQAAQVFLGAGRNRGGGGREGASLTDDALDGGSTDSVDDSADHSHDHEVDGLNDVVIGRLIATSLAMLDKYVPAFLSIVYGNELARDAIRRVESGVDPRE